MVLQTSGRITLSNIATEYGLPASNVLLSDLYKNVSLEAFTKGGGGRGNAGVGVIGSSNVPIAGPLKFSNYYGQKRMDTTLLSFPTLAMTNYTSHLGSNALSRDLTNVTQATIESEGWTCSKAMTATASGLQWGGIGTLTTSAISGMPYGVGIVEVRVIGSALEGGEMFSVTINDGAKTYVAASQELTVDLTVTIDLRTVSAALIDRFSSTITVSINSVIGAADLIAVKSVRVQFAETYIASSSTDRTSGLAAWMAFDQSGGTVWQSADGCYDVAGAATASVLVNGYDMGYNGSWLALTVPYPIFPTSFEVLGTCADFRLYGSISPSDPTQWVLLHDVTGRTGGNSTTDTYTLSPSPSTSPYIVFVLKINKVLSNPGFGRASMTSVVCSGYRG